jgi:hypothetical protein
LIRPDRLGTASFSAGWTAASGRSGLAEAAAPAFVSRICMVKTAGPKELLEPARAYAIQLDIAPARHPPHPECTIISKVIAVS